MSEKALDTRITAVENRMLRIERLIWYIAGILTLNLGEAGLKLVSAMINA